MKLSYLFAKRYLIAKKTHNAINIISIISVCGVAIISMALICTLSVYNGFHDLVSSLYSNFDSELTILPSKGKTFKADLPVFDEIRQLPEVAYFGEVLQEQVLINYQDRQQPAMLKGVDSNYEHITSIDSIIINGEYKLKDEVVDYATVGVGLASRLNVNAGFVRPLEIYVPNRYGTINLANPTNSFVTGRLFVSGIFAVNQAKYDDFYLITNIDHARSLFGENDLVSSIELKVKEASDISKIQKRLKSMLGPDYKVLNRMELQADSFKIMQIEKWMTFLILFFILIIASFNVIGSLSMLIVDKSSDIETLRKLGADNSLIQRIFLIEGCLISGFGAIVGIVLGVALCWVQQEYGLLSMGNGAGMFIVDAYPVKLILTDVISVVLAVSLIGYLTALYPVKTMLKEKK